ncbi:MAG: bifunctional nuclease family protein [Acidimicrobiia bacterium]
MELLGVRVEVPANTPMVLLQSQLDDQRLLPIYIGSPEASAIHYALEGVSPPRPLTHDLFVGVLTQLGAEIERVVITEVREHTYYAQLHLLVDGEPQVVDCRPSDAIALAVRTASPIFADDELLDQVGQRPEPAGEEEAEEIIDEFKDFIESVSPEDFAS